VAGDLRSTLRTGARSATGRTLPFAVLLAVVVVLAAGIGGTSDFTGARWIPNFGGSHTGAPRTRTSLIPTSTAPRRAHVKLHNPALPAWVGVTALVLIVIAVSVVVWRWWRVRRLPSGPRLSGASVQATQQLVQAEPEPEPEKLRTGIELALEALDDEREPADAVVRAWLGLQQTAEESGIVRHPSETPTEFTSRILAGALTDDRAVRTLLRLYLQTRFGDHPVTSQDVAEVRDALHRLVASWQSPTGAPTTRSR
jgi:hypothetical protein